MASAVGVIATCDGPTLIHCVAGKDRTGVTVALALRLLGISREQVIEEYLLTNRIAGELVHRLRSHHKRMSFRDGTRPVTVDNVQAPRALLEAAMDRWDDHPHGVVGWFRDAGGDTDTITLLKVRLLPA